MHLFKTYRGVPCCIYCVVLQILCGLHFLSGASWADYSNRFLTKASLLKYYILWLIKKNPLQVDIKYFDFILKVFMKQNEPKETWLRWDTVSLYSSTSASWGPARRPIKWMQLFDPGWYWRGAQHSEMPLWTTDEVHFIYISNTNY